MKRVFLFSFLALMGNLAFAQVHEISLLKKRSELNSMSKSQAGLRFSFTHEKLFSKTSIAKNGSSYTDIWVKGSYPNGEIGTPKLPAYKKLIRIPKGTKPVVKILSHSEEIINLKEKGINNPICPNQPSVRKDQDSTKVKFQIKKETYAKSTFSNAPIATIEVLGNLRSATIARLVVNPVDYNPGNGLLKVYNDIDVDVSFDSPTSVDIEQDYSAKTYSPYFDVIYKSLEGSLKSSYSDHPDLTKYPVKMLIISDRMFESTLQPFTQWKNIKGFNVKTVYTDEIGTTADQIKSYIQQEYNSATPESPAPTFLVIVGDVGQVEASATGSQTSRLTDLYYASVDGDMFPDMYYGRLSATSTAQLENIIGKILYYEKYQFEDPGYLNSVTLIAGADGEWNPKVGQPTIKYGTANYFNQSKGFVNINEFGVTSDPSNPSASSSYTGCYSADRIAVGLVNYTAHCSEISWADPYLSTTSVSSFTNTNKYPLAIGNCCLSGDFGTSECIGETWIRAQGKGAVTYIGSSPSTYWLEDFYWAVGAFPMVGENDGYVPTFQETTTGMYDAPFVSKYVTAGGMVFAGNLSVTEVNVQGYPSQSSPTYYWEAYNILGDPSLMPYFTEADANQVYHDPAIIIGETSFSVNALADSYIAISKDNQLIGTSFVSKTGEVSVPITPVTSSGDVIVVVTRPQTIPYIDTITATSPTGPYLMLNSFTVDDHLSNNNGKADYNETFSINLKVKNIGIKDATNVKVKFFGVDNNISIQSNDSISISNIPYSDGVNTIDANNAFSFKAQENVPDQYVATFTLKFYSDQGNWASKLRIPVNSPVLTLDELEIDDSFFGGNNDNLLNPGESCKAFVNVVNNGHASAKDITFQISVPDSVQRYVSVNSIQTEPFSLDESSISTLPFRVSVNPELRQEFELPIILQANVVEPSGQSTTFERSIKIFSNDSVNISNDTLKTCFTYFYDAGGKNGNYSNFENYTTTLTAQNEYSCLKVKFLEFSTELGYDYLYIFNGSNTTSPQISGSPFSGTALPAEIFSSSRCLTFQFKSDNSNVSKGWKATVECVEPQIPGCVVAPSPSDGAQAVQPGSLNWAAQKYASFYDVFLGFSPTSLALVGRVDKPEFTFNPEKSKTYYWKATAGNYLGLNSSSCNTWSFTTDTISSINMSTNTSIVDTLLFYDSGGPFQNYMNDENYTLTFRPKYTGNSVNVQFLSFNLESEASCSYDKLSIYDGATTNSPVIGTYCGINSPGTIQASNSDGALTMLFQSDISDAFSGWAAIVRSTGPTVFKTVTIKVQANSSPIANASANIGGVIKTTDNNGYVSFTAIAGDVNLTVNALGYKPLSKVVAESESNSTIIIDLEKLSSINIRVLDKMSLKSIPSVKVKTLSDSSYTNSLGQTTLHLTSGTYTLYFSLNGYLPYSQELIVNESDSNLDITLTAIKHRVSIIVYDAMGNKIDGALVSINDTILTANSEGSAVGYFYSGNYPTTVSKTNFFPLTTWVLVNDTTTKRVNLDAILSLYNLELSIIGSGPKNTFQFLNNDVDLYFNNIFYSRFTTDAHGKGSLQLPKGNFYHNITCEGYYSIVKKPFIVDGIIRSIIDTMYQKTFPVQFNVKFSLSPVQDVTVTLNDYSPEFTDSSGQALFTNIGFEKELHYLVQKDGFVEASGKIDVIEPLTVNITLESNGEGNHVKIYPNPTSDRISIISKYPITRIAVVNVLGLAVLNNYYSSLFQANISMGSQPSGVYILIIYTDSLVPKKVLVIKK